MNRLTRLSVIAAAVLMPAVPAIAADMGVPYVPEARYGGWYLRGDIGFSNQSVGSLYNVLYDTTDVTHVFANFDAAPFGGVGVGYQFNQWFRMDLTAEYRGSANFHGMDTFTDSGPAGASVDVYTGRKYEITGLVNAYFDLGTWHSITPFIGAGVGVSRNTIADFTDSGLNAVGPSVAYGKDSSKVNFAWALMAGLGYQVTPGLTLEGAYRYINLGDAQSGDLVTFNGVNTIYNPMKFKDITSHDIKFGMRWALGGATPAYSDPPLMRKY